MKGEGDGAVSECISLSLLESRVQSLPLSKCKKGFNNFFPTSLVDIRQYHKSCAQYGKEKHKFLEQEMCHGMEARYKAEKCGETSTAPSARCF